MAEKTSVSFPNSLSLLLALALLAALIGCGPAPSEEASRSGVSDKGIGSARGGGLTPFPAPREVSVPLGTGTVAGGKGDSPRAEPAPLSSAAGPTPLASHEQSLPDTRDQPARLQEHLVLPDSIAKELDSPDVSVRLHALDRWAQQGPKASLDPLVVALDDEDEAVRAKAMAIIEQQLAIEPEREEVTGEQ